MPSKPVQSPWVTRHRAVQLIRNVTGCSIEVAYMQFRQLNVQEVAGLTVVDRDELDQFLAPRSVPSA